MAPLRPIETAVVALTAAALLLAGMAGVRDRAPSALAQGGSPAQVTAADAGRDRCFPETGFCVEHDALWEYFDARGGTQTFGFPASRTVTFLGCATQFFQRHVLQQCAGGPVQRLNLLDPGLMPVNQINASTFPAHDPAVAAAAPPPGTADYGEAVLAHVRNTVPNTFEGLPVGFFDEFTTTAPGSVGDPDLAALVVLELWGFPTSRPAFDPNNRAFVYQRFQRGIMHYDHTTRTTAGILLGDWYKSAITGQSLPPDLAAQMQGSRFLRQYCPGNPRWLCRPDELPATDLSLAFEPPGAASAAPTPPAATRTPLAGPTPPAVTPTPAAATPTPPIEGLSPEAQRAAEAALQAAAARLGVGLDQVRVARIERREWSDTSLGCPQPGMLYLQVITPGYLIIVEGAGQQLEYHTDTRGRVVLCQGRG